MKIFGEPEETKERVKQNEISYAEEIQKIYVDTLPSRWIIILTP